MKSLMTLLALLIPASLSLFAQTEPAQQSAPAQLLPNQQTTLTWPVPEEWPAGEVRFQILKDDRTLARGVAIRKSVDEKEVLSIDVTIRSRTIPSIVEAKVQFSCNDKTFESPVYLFPKSPFSDRTKFLKSANIELFDSDGGAATVFDQHKIPFRLLKQVEDADFENSNLLIIAASDSFGDEGFAKSLFNSALNGQTILCLCPENSQLKFGRLRSRIVLEGSALPFFKSGRVLESFLEPDLRWQPTQKENSILLTAGENKTGWPWIEIHPRLTETKQPKPGKIIFSGLKVIEKHDQVPAARHVLWKLIESQLNSTNNERGNHESSR